MSFPERIREFYNLLSPIVAIEYEWTKIYTMEGCITNCAVTADTLTEMCSINSSPEPHYSARFEYPSTSEAILEYFKQNLTDNRLCYMYWAWTTVDFGHVRCYALVDDVYYLLESNFGISPLRIAQFTKDQFNAHLKSYLEEYYATMKDVAVSYMSIPSYEEIKKKIDEVYSETVSAYIKEEKDFVCKMTQRNIDITAIENL